MGNPGWRAALSLAGLAICIGEMPMKKKIQAALLMTLLGLSVVGESAFAAEVPAADIPEAAFALGRRTEQAVEGQRRMVEYHRHTAGEEKREKADPLTVEAPKAAAEAEGELSFDVKEIRVTKSKLLSDEEIKKAIHFKGPGETNISELRAMVDRLNDLYREKKIGTAQAVLPPQEVKDGVVFIRLIEGTYGKVKVTGNHRISEKALLDRIHGTMGELVDVERLQHGLRLYNATNTYQVKANLVPGEEEGTSDLFLDLQEKENPLTSFIYTDNAGQYESGRYRIGAYTEYRGIGGRDASIAFAPVWTRGIWGGSILFDTPVGNKGTHASISYSRNEVDIVRGAFKDFDMDARSNDLAFSLTHPLNVTTLTKTDAFFELHKKWSDTQYGGMALADVDTITAKAGVSSRIYDNHGMWFLLGSVTKYNSDDNFRHKDNDGYYYNLYFMRRQTLAHDQYLTGRLYGQFTNNKTLPSTEQFSLGGMASVRGYKESTLSGDKGWFGGLEWNFPVSPDHRTWRGFVFFDHGACWNNFSVGTEKQDITSTGLGFEYAKGGWYGKLVLGIPLSESDNVNAGDDPRIHFYLQRNV